MRASSIVLAVAAGIILVGGAAAYREVTRLPQTIAHQATKAAVREVVAGTAGKIAGGTVGGVSRPGIVHPRVTRMTRKVLSSRVHPDVLARRKPVAVRKVVRRAPVASRGARVHPDVIVKRVVVPRGVPKSRPRNRG